MYVELVQNVAHLRKTQGQAALVVAKNYKDKGQTFERDYRAVEGVIFF